VRFEKIVVLVCLIAVTNYSCKRNAGRNINQGEIHYRIDYSGNLGTLPLSLKPNTLVVSFKDNKILFDILTPVGNQGISNLSNPDINAYDIYVTMIYAKIVYSCKPGEVPPGFSSMSGMKIKKTLKIKEICGYNCKNAEITFDSAPGKVYNVWYTNEIKVKDPNAVTPFKEIDGVMMSFFYFMGQTELHFEAENVYKKDIPDKTFERKAKFKPTTKENMENTILQMINY
jgi:hypothetical protein